MEEKQVCTNCRGPMRFLKRENVQLGKTGWIVGDWSNLFAGAQDLEFWVCPRCRKLDFYIPRSEMEPEDADGGQAVWSEADGGGMAQVICPACGAEHDMDDPKCPRCGTKNTDLY